MYIVFKAKQYYKFIGETKFPCLMPLHFYPIPYSSVNTKLFLHIPIQDDL